MRSEIPRETGAKDNPYHTRRENDTVGIFWPYLIKICLYLIGCQMKKSTHKKNTQTRKTERERERLKSEKEPKNDKRRRVSLLSLTCSVMG